MPQGVRGPRQWSVGRVPCGQTYSPSMQAAGLNTPKSQLAPGGKHPKPGGARHARGTAGPRSGVASPKSTSLADESNAKSVMLSGLTEGAVPLVSRPASSAGPDCASPTGAAPEQPV